MVALCLEPEVCISFLYQPSRTSISHTLAMPRPSHRTQQAQHHAEHGWVPVNPGSLEHIQANLALGTYEGDSELLIHDLKDDPALFLYCIKNIRPLIADPGGAIDPIEEIKKLEEEKLQQLLTVPPSAISPHRFTEATPAQTKRFQYSLISTKTAETIGSKLEVGPDAAFTGAALHQLGYDLIAWNYPKIFAQVMRRHKTEGVNIDFEIRKLLGVTPLQLASRITSSWGLNPSIRSALEYDPESTKVAAEGAPLSLQKICGLSELFAQTKDPDTFPEAKELWVAQEKEIQQILPSDLLDEVEENVRKAMLNQQIPSAMLDTLPLFDTPVGTELTPLRRGTELFKENLHLHRCSEHIVETFTKVYKKIEESQISLDALRMLANEVAPQAGFVRGCVYLLQQNTLELKPTLRIGDTSLTKYQQFLFDSRNGIIASEQSPVPMKQRGIGVTGQTSIQIAGSLHNTNCPGVLYLELDPRVEGDPLHDPISLFHAIRQTFNHCMNLRTEPTPPEKP